jgi:hypothetical protein
MIFMVRSCSHGLVFGGRQPGRVAVVATLASLSNRRTNSIAATNRGLAREIGASRAEASAQTALGRAIRAAGIKWRRA